MKFPRPIKLKPVKPEAPYTMHYMEKPKHWDLTHFAAITVGGRKFVYCPVGNICSWAEGDYDHRYCAWCKKYFTDIGVS